MLGREIGPYKILEKIGQGGMGIVYQGIHRQLEQEVAIKVLSPAYAAEPSMRERFVQEAKIQARLTHPHVVNILNYLEDGADIFLVMEYVKGETLDKRLGKVGSLSQHEAVLVCQSVLAALDFMHSKGVIHRDIKPGNIMFTDTGVVKVTDFGIAKITGDHGQTQTGMRIGTLWYMSPEQIKGQPASVASDLYALGITLYQMVTGKLPFYGDSEYTLMKAHLEEVPEAPWLSNTYISQDLGRMILKAIEKTPERRYRSAYEFAEALTALTYQPDTPHRDIPRARERPSFRRRFLPLRTWQYVTFASLSVMLGSILYMSASDSGFMIFKRPSPIVAESVPSGRPLSSPSLPLQPVLPSPQQAPRSSLASPVDMVRPPNQLPPQGNVSVQKSASSEASEHTTAPATVTPAMASIPLPLPPSSSLNEALRDGTAETKEVYAWIIVATEKALDVSSSRLHISRLENTIKIAKERGNASTKVLQENLVNMTKNVNLRFDEYVDAVKRIAEKDKKFVDISLEAYLDSIKSKEDYENIKIVNSVIKNHIDYYKQYKKANIEQWKSDLEKL
jgi:serine/threonine-protein kinase